MHNRLQSHALKMAHLELLFEREKRNMTKSAFNRIKTKKYKNMIRRIQLISTDAKKAILAEYFSMCKMVYRIRSTVSYYQYEDYDEKSKLTALQKVQELYNEDDTFAKMMSIVRTSLVNIFAGTDPAQILLKGDDSEPSSP